MNTQTTKKWTKADERKLMADLDRERMERDAALPKDQQHEEPAWVSSFWMARQVLL